MTATPVWLQYVQVIGLAVVSGLLWLLGAALRSGVFLQHTKSTLEDHDVRLKDLETGNTIPHVKIEERVKSIERRWDEGNRELSKLTSTVNTLPDRTRQMVEDVMQPQINAVSSRLTQVESIVWGNDTPNPNSPPMGFRRKR
jgi:hypothetical protein